MKLQINADVPDRWVPVLLGMLKRMEYLGRVGMSRAVTINSDGDGDFKPVFEFKSQQILPDAVRPALENGGDQYFDAG